MMDIYSGKALEGNANYNQSIKLILLTPKGERVLNRSFGSKVSSYLGQPVNNVVMEISAEVISSLQSNDVRIYVDKVSLNNTNNSGLTLTVDYNDVNNIAVEI